MTTQIKIDSKNTAIVRIVGKGKKRRDGKWVYQAKCIFGIGPDIPQNLEICFDETTIEYKLINP